MNYIFSSLSKLLAFFSKLIKSDKLYISIDYFFATRRLKLSPPVTFNEKLQWLKLNDKHPEYTHLVDKSEVKEIVKNIIGEKHIIPTLGIYNKFNEIEKDKLPERFVIKCTHDSGGVCICKNKNKFNWEEAEKKINKSLKNEFFWNHREYPYKGIKPRIMIEEYLEDNSPKGLVDYKFFCFHGEPRLVLVASNRQKNVNFDFFDMDFKHCPFKQEYDILSKDLIEKPTLFEEMKKIAKVLSKDILHVRVDLYCINNHIYFGEYTFFNNAGNENFIPQEWDTIIGSWLTLPLQSKNYQQI